jgi:putative oxidoreductase
LEEKSHDRQQNRSLRRSHPARVPGFLAHGLYLKIFVFTVGGTVGFFESLGLPAVLAYATIAAESLGGLALILGVFTRWVSLALLPVLLGALWVHSGNGWLFTAEGGGWEYPLFLAAAALTQALLGDGAHALKPSGGVARMVSQSA